MTINIDISKLKKIPFPSNHENKELGVEDKIHQESPQQIVLNIYIYIIGKEGLC